MAERVLSMSTVKYSLLTLFNQVKLCKIIIFFHLDESNIFHYNILEKLDASTKTKT